MSLFGSVPEGSMATKDPSFSNSAGCKLFCHVAFLAFGGAAHENLTVGLLVHSRPRSTLAALPLKSSH